VPKEDVALFEKLCLEGFQSGLVNGHIEGCATRRAFASHSASPTLL
jgi:3-methyladenine DNA glycosylase Tag